MMNRMCIFSVMNRMYIFSFLYDDSLSFYSLLSGFLLYICLHIQCRNHEAWNSLIDVASGCNLQPSVAELEVFIMSSPVMFTFLDL